jgi:hypothetical protein
VEEAAATGDPERLRIGPSQAIARLRRDGDPFAPVAGPGQRLAI